jgi:hypothetical protein
MNFCKTLIVAVQLANHSLLARRAKKENPAVHLHNSLIPPRHQVCIALHRKSAILHRWLHEALQVAALQVDRL